MKRLRPSLDRLENVRAAPYQSSDSGGRTRISLYANVLFGRVDVRGRKKSILMGKHLCVLISPSFPRRGFQFNDIGKIGPKEIQMEDFAGIRIRTGIKNRAIKVIIEIDYINRTCWRGGTFFSRYYNI